jgi:hypothetical protein
MVVDLDRPGEIFDDLDQRDRLPRRQLTGGDGIDDCGRRGDRIRRRFHARHVERYRPVFSRRTKPAQAKANRGNVAAFRHLDRRAHDLLGFAIEHCLDDARRLVSRARRPAGWIPTLTWRKRHD